jgi:hypothetical protein
MNQEIILPSEDPVLEIPAGMDCPKGHLNAETSKEKW